jgi:phosphatidylglycerophosphate synthase
MLPSLLFLIIVSRDFPIQSILISAIAFAFVTDLVDGWISRTTHQETYIGKILDAVSDYSLLLVIAFAYIVFQLIPLWLFCIILLRLLFQAIGMLILLIIHKTVEPQSTFYGKITVATIMVLFVLELFRLCSESFFIQYLPFIEYAAGVIVGLSIFEKFCFFLKTNKTMSSC